MNDSIEISLFKHGSTELMQMLDEASISYEKRMPPLGVAVASAESIALMGLIGAVVVALAPVLTAWVEKDASRKVMITTKDGVTVHLEGHSQKTMEEIEKLLLTSKQTVAIQTKPNKE